MSIHIAVLIMFFPRRTNANPAFVPANVIIAIARLIRKKAPTLPLSAMSSTRLSVDASRTTT